MHQMLPWGARGSQESPQQISAQYNKIGGRKHTILLLDPTVQLWTFSNKKISPKFHILAKKSNVTKMHQMFPWGARGSQESPQQISAQYNKIGGRKHHFAFGPYRPTLNIFN